MLHPWLFSGRQIISSIAQTPTMKSAAERLIKRQRVFFSFDLCFQNTAMAIAFPTMITKHSTAKANVHRITSTARSSAISLDVSTRGKIALFSFMTPILSSSILQLVEDYNGSDLCKRVKPCQTLVNLFLLSHDLYANYKLEFLNWFSKNDSFLFSFSFVVTSVYMQLFVSSRYQ